MNKNIILAAIGVLVVIAGIGFSLTYKPLVMAPGAEGSLKELLSFQGSQKCTLDSQSGLADSTGEVYVSHGKMRGDFISNAQGQTVKSHMIINGSTSYIWTDILNQGFKIPLEKMTVTGANQQQGVDLDQSLKYSCAPWIEDATLLTPPIDVQFNDMSSMMNQATSPINPTVSNSSTASSLQAQCGACDQASDATVKAQCRAVLGCK